MSSNVSSSVSVVLTASEVRIMDAAGLPVSEMKDALTVQRPRALSMIEQATRLELDSPTVAGMD